MRIKRLGSAALLPLAILGVLLVPAEADALGSVTGTVTPLEWSEEVEVCLVEGRPSETCTVPKADGSYLLERVPLGEIYVEFVPSIRSRLLTQYYDHQSSLVDATPIHLSVLQPAATGIDADLIEGGAIKGTVTAAGTASPLAEVEVCALLMPSAALRRCEETGAGGAYEIHSLPTGNYKVVFRGRGKSAGYASTYYDGKETAGQANLVSVSAEEATEGIDASLEKGAEIEGSVTEAEGGPLAGIAVCLFEAAVSTADRCTYSDAVGAYAFEGLSGGSYQVGFSLEPGEFGSADIGEDDGFESQYFNGVSTRAQAATISVLAPSLVTGVNAVLARPPEPSAVTPPPAVANPIVAAPPVVPEPEPAAKKCRKGFKKKKVKGKVRCVKVRKAVHRHHRRKHSHHRGQKGKK